MYLDCVKVGINAKDFWDLSWEELMCELEAIQFRKEQEIKERSSFDYKQAQLNAYAFHSPNKIPKIEEVYPFLDGIKEENQPLENEQALLNFINNFKIEGEEV